MKLAELLIDESVDQVFALNTGFEVTVWNKTCETVSGIPRNEIVGKNYFSFFPRLEQARQLVDALNAALKGNKSFIPHDRLAADGCYVEKHIIPLKDEQGGVIGILNIIHDVAHRVKAEDELLSYQKSIETLNDELLVRQRQLESLNSELKTFTNIAVNDYSETLRQLYLYFEYIVAHDAAKLSDAGKANIRKAQAAIQKMKLLTSDITAYTRLSEFDIARQPIALDGVVKTVFDDLQASIGSANADTMVSPLPEIYGYPFLVSLLFHHLVENAIKFRSSSERLTITVSAQLDVQGSAINNRSARPGLSYHIVTVQDNGIGFGQDQVETIFQIFTRLNPGKQKGSGIGLAICKKVMELHGGFIAADSTPGQGSAFHCYFPVRQYDSHAAS